ncbi:MAG: 23S rRNA (guanosine(2251)-2'-O)-methyltransferase RlmB [Chloroflexi bacterium]|nr:23S rRNA (guanosine(2251)-2'-O)-methyltransferase RlmB [Chloroflexota bacterium]MDA8188392.1 23S rRNA (guanosine(2251)-2'-O)-methyltransferase RlmB [Dehalococcoidales bacterium]
MTIIWGRNAVNEALKAGRDVDKVLIAEGTRPAGIVAEIVGAARSQGISVQYLDRRAIERLARTDKHQGVVAEVSEFEYATVDEILELAHKRGEYPFILILDTLQDPQNLGSLIRTAEAVGVHGIIIPKHRAVGVTPAVVKASGGAVEHLPVARVTNLSRAIEELKKQGVWVVGVDMEGDRAYDEADVNIPVAFVVGAEGKGISRLVKEKCDFLVNIPMRGHVASLNAAVAGSIVVYHAWRQRSRIKNP